MLTNSCARLPNFPHLPTSPPCFGVPTAVRAPLWQAPLACLPPSTPPAAAFQSPPQSSCLGAPVAVCHFVRLSLLIPVLQPPVRIILHDDQVVLLGNLCTASAGHAHSTCRALCFQASLHQERTAHADHVGLCPRAICASRVNGACTAHERFGIVPLSNLCIMAAGPCTHKRGGTTSCLTLYTAFLRSSVITAPVGFCSEGGG